MICPHCKQYILEPKDIILKELKLREGNISDLVKRTKIKRSTLVYYLLLLKEERLIISDRKQKGITGRPNIFTLNDKQNKDSHKGEGELKV